MKGLLHRLAARAAGTAVAVRSDARLPYGADRLVWGGAPEQPPAWEPQERLQADAARRPPPAGVELARGDPASTREAVSVAEPALVPAQRSRSNVEVFEQDGQAEAVLREPATLRGAVPEANPFSRGAPPRHEAAPAVSEPVMAPEAPAVGRIDAASQLGLPTAALAAMPPAAPRRAAWLSEAPTWDELPHPSSRAASADPTPLLPPAPRFAGAMGEPAAGPSVFERPQRAWPLAAPASAADEATEVHIHIGRIDVTAVHEAPKLRAKPGAKSTALSLDAYLAARSKA